MKKTFLTLLTVAAFSLVGCFEDVVKVTVPAKYSTSFTIKAPIAAGTIDTVVSSTMLTDNEDFKKLNVTVDNVETAKLTSLKLTITSPANATFEALESVTFLIRDAGGNEIMVATIPGAMDKSSNTIDVELYDEDLAPFIKSGEITLAGQVLTKSDILEDLVIQADLESDIKVNP